METLALSVCYDGDREMLDAYISDSIDAHVGSRGYLFVTLHGYLLTLEEHVRMEKAGTITTENRLYKEGNTFADLMDGMLETFGLFLWLTVGPAAVDDIVDGVAREGVQWARPALQKWWSRSFKDDRC